MLWIDAHIFIFPVPWRTRSDRDRGAGFGGENKRSVCGNIRENEETAEGRFRRRHLGGAASHFEQTTLLEEIVVYKLALK